MEPADIQAAIDKVLSQTLIGDLDQDILAQFQEGGEFRPGVIDTLEALINAINKSVMREHLMSQLDEANNVVEHVILSTALKQNMAQGREAFNTLQDTMLNLEEPLDVLLVLADWTTYQAMQGLQLDEDTTIADMQQVAAAVWQIVGGISHQYVLDRDILRDKCTICLGLPSSDLHNFLAGPQKKDGDHEND